MLALIIVLILLYVLGGIATAMLLTTSKISLHMASLVIIGIFWPLAVMIIIYHACK